MALSPAFLAELERIVGARGVVSTPEGRLVYECGHAHLLQGRA